MLRQDLPSRDGWLAKCSVHLEVRLPDGGSISTPSGGLTFGFEWLYPTPAEIATTRELLRLSLARPAKSSAGVDLADALLLIPSIRAGIALTEITAAMEGAKPNRRQGRETLARRLHELGYPWQQLVDDFVQRLNNHSPFVCDDLAHAPTDFWDDAFLEPLLQRHDLHPKLPHAVTMQVLGRQAARWTGKREVTQRLYDATMSRHEKWLQASLKDQVASSPQQSWNSIVWNWAQAVRPLAISRHPEAMQKLRPFLHDTSPRHNGPSHGAPCTPVPHPMRVGDVALDAMLAIHYGDTSKGYVALDDTKNPAIAANGRWAYSGTSDEIHDRTIGKLLIEIDK